MDLRRGLGETVEEPFPELLHLVGHPFVSRAERYCKVTFAKKPTLALPSPSLVTSLSPDGVEGACLGVLQGTEGLWKGIRLTKTTPSGLQQPWDIPDQPIPDCRKRPWDLGQGSELLSSWRERESFWDIGSPACVRRWKRLGIDRSYGTHGSSPQVRSLRESVFSQA